MMISVIVPAYNEEKYLPKTLRSLERQTYRDFETIVIANGCTDKTAAVAKKAGVRLIISNRKKIGAARNLGFSKAKGEIIVFLDADTQPSFNALAQIHKHFTKEFSAGTLYARPDADRFIYSFIMGVKNFVHEFGFYKGSSGILITRAKVMKKVKFPELNVRENRMFIREALAFGKYFYFDKAHVTTSMRRYEKWGPLHIWWFWIKKFFQQRREGLENEEYEAVR